jgi:hypothetical protein
MHIADYENGKANGMLTEYIKNYADIASQFWYKVGTTKDGASYGKFTYYRLGEVFETDEQYDWYPDWGGQ